MNKGTAIIGFVLCFIAGAGLMWGVDRQGLVGSSHQASAEAFAEGGTWSDEDSPVPISSKDPMWGSRNAPVTMVVFSDFECPFCSRVEGTITQLKEKYGPEKLRVLWKNSPLPFHKNAKPAALAAETVFRLGGSKAFWKFHELAFANQKALTPENFEAWAGQAGVDVAKFKASYDKQEFAAKVDQDQQIGQKAGVSGTPASFINGVFLSGAQPIDKFTSVIDAELAAADQLVKSGTAVDKVYVKRSTENKSKNPPPQDPKKKEQDTKTVWKVPVGDSPARGPATALVTIVEFSDFQCPFCSKVEPTIDELVKTYGDKLRVVWKHNPLPFHKQAPAASMLTIEARAQKGEEGFWAAHHLLFKNQKELGEDKLAEYAKELGLDVEKVKTAIAEKKHQAVISADQAVAEDFQAGGTPHFFINGRRLSGAQPVDKFKEIIDEEIKKAEALVKAGTAPKDVYAELTKEGKEPPPPEKKTIAAPPADAPWKGGKDAKVVINLVSDFECPFCGKVEDTMKEIEAAYGDKVKIYWRHKPLPMHKNAPLASEAAQEVWKQKGNEAFWKYHDVLFKSQKSPGLAREQLEKYAEELGGIDMPKFKKALDDRTHQKFVEAEAKAADEAGIGGTPGIVINGYFVGGAAGFGKFKKLIDLAAKEAAGGGAPADAKKDEKKDAKKEEPKKDEKKGK